jgi:hypothetical protein
VSVLPPRAQKPSVADQAARAAVKPLYDYLKRAGLRSCVDGGGLAIMRPLDKFGSIPVPILFLIAIPIVASIGTPGLSEGVTIALVAAAGFCLLGLQFGNIASSTHSGIS